MHRQGGLPHKPPRLHHLALERAHIARERIDKRPVVKAAVGARRHALRPYDAPAAVLDDEGGEPHARRARYVRLQRLIFARDRVYGAAVLRPRVIQDDETRAVASRDRVLIRARAAVHRLLRRRPDHGARPHDHRQRAHTHRRRLCDRHGHARGGQELCVYGYILAVIIHPRIDERHVDVQRDGVAVHQHEHGQLPGLARQLHRQRLRRGADGVPEIAPGSVLDLAVKLRPAPAEQERISDDTHVVSPLVTTRRRPCQAP